jgi:hypothetical protein
MWRVTGLLHLLFDSINQPEGALRASRELCEVRKQGRIFTTEDMENTEGEEKGKGSKQYATSGWHLPSQVAAFTLLYRL